MIYCGMGWFWQQSDTLQLVDNSIGKNELPGLPVYKTHTYSSQDALHLLCTNGLPMVVLDGTYHFVAGLALPGIAKVCPQSLLCMHTCTLGLSKTSSHQAI